MWLCYTIRKLDNFRQLSVVSKDLKEIYDFITTVTDIDSESFTFEIEFNPIFNTEKEN